MPLSITQMKSRWKRLTGEEMPLSVQLLPTDKILLALDRLKNGDDVFVPVEREPAVASNHGDSMMDWDADGFH